MKILVLSLLRLGDSLMHLHLVEDLRGENPEAQIHFVVNDAFQFAGELIQKKSTTISQVHFFPRSLLQDDLVLRSGSLFQALGNLTSWIQGIQAQNFDRVIDLTHTRLSRALVQALDIEEQAATNPQFLNEIFSRSRTSSFHYRDALRQHFDLSLNRSMAKIEARGGKKIYIQMSTSDSKKNWSDLAWNVFFDHIHAIRPDLELYLLGAPNERAALSHFVQNRPWLNIAVCGLLELDQILSQADALISTDTMALHLAALNRVPIFALFLGSAEPSKTAPWIQGAWVLQSLEACAPCIHSKPCHQSRHHCSLSLDGLEVAQCFLTFMDRSRELPRFSKFTLWETRKGYQGNLVLKNIESPESLALQSLKQFCFSKEIGLAEAVDAFMQGLECEAWEKSMIVRELWISHQRVGEILKLLTLELQELSAEALHGNSFSKSSWSTLNNWIREFRMLSDDAEWTSLFEQSLGSSVESSTLSVFHSLKQVYELCEKFHSRQFQVLQILMKRVSEKGVFYVPGSSRQA